MAMNLVLQNQLGEVIRVFPWKHYENVWAVFRQDTKRLEVTSNLSPLTKDKVPFQIVQQASRAQLEKGGVALAGFGKLSLAESQAIAPKLSEASDQQSQSLRKAVLYSFLIYLVIGYLLIDVFAPSVEVAEEKLEEKKQEIVKVVRKKLSIPPTTQRQTISLNQERPQQSKPTAEKKGWKRSGALAALGQLNKSNQKGGLDLGAVKATAGPGMGGTQGSGGVQTSIYSKGLVAAPLGAGHNIKGAGGYGTAGKGGGKAGFGTTSLVGATGASLIPIPEEATVDGGLDGSLIADVVRRNLGQIRFCYEQGLQLDPSLTGRVAVNWVIDGGGRVKTAQVKDTSLNNKTIEDCILRRLRTWKFPIPEGNQEVPVSYPFLLKRTGTSS